MALIKCPECGRQVSTEAAACPGCGYPVAQSGAGEGGVLPSTLPAAPTEPLENQTPLMVIRPSWLTFGWHLLFFWLVVPLIIALYRRHSLVMRIYSDRVSIEEGFWAKEYSEFFVRDIRSIDVRQGIWDRLFDIGDVAISTAATSEAAEKIRGIPSPNHVKETLISLRQQFPP